MKNPQDFALTSVTRSVRQGLPGQYITGVILSYLVNAALIAFIFYPTFLKLAEGNGIMAAIIVIGGAAVVQYFRYLIVFTDQLVPNGVQSSRFIVRCVAFGMFVFSSIEIYHAFASVDWLTGSKFWGLAMFGWGIVTGGYILEISFVKKMNELTDIEVGAAYIDDSEVKERIREEQEAERTEHSHPAADTQTKNKGYSPEELQAMMKAAVEQAMTEMRKAEAAQEGVEVPFDLTATNGNGNGRH